MHTYSRVLLAFTLILTSPHLASGASSTHTVSSGSNSGETLRSDSLGRAGGDDMRFMTTQRTWTQQQIGSRYRPLCALSEVEVRAWARGVQGRGKTFNAVSVQSEAQFCEQTRVTRVPVWGGGFREENRTREWEWGYHSVSVPNVFWIYNTSFRGYGADPEFRWVRPVLARYDNGIGDRVLAGGLIDISLGGAGRIASASVIHKERLATGDGRNWLHWVTVDSSRRTIFDSSLQFSRTPKARGRVRVAFGYRSARADKGVWVGFIKWRQGHLVNDVGEGDSASSTIDSKGKHRRN